MDSLNQPPSPQPAVEQTPIPPKSSVNSKALLIATTVFIVIMIGLITYVLAAKTKPTSQSSTISRTIPQPSTTPDETANWKTYTNTQYKYSIRYPSDWQIKSYCQGGGVGQPKDREVCFLSPDIKESTRPGTGGLAAGLLNGGFVFINAFPDFEGHETPDNICKSNPLEQVLECKQIIINDLTAYRRIVYNYNAIEIGIVKNGKFVLSLYAFYSEPAKTHMIQVFDQILSTFQFSN